MSSRRPKVVLIGDAGVGKTRLLFAALGAPCPSSIPPGVAVHVLATSHGELDVWDFNAGNGLRDAYYMGADAAIHVQSGTTAGDQWRREFEAACPSAPVYVVSPGSNAKEVFDGVAADLAR